MNGLQPYLDAIIERWRRENIPIRPGVDVASIANFESRYAVALPNDMREFFSRVDGMGDEYDEDSFFRFWPFEQVQPIERYYPELKNMYAESSSYFLFFDYSVDLFNYAIRLQQNANAAIPVARLYAQDDGYLQVNFQSFADVIVKYATNPDDLL